MSYDWENLVNNLSLKSMNKSEYVEFLKQYSFNVPDIAVRHSILDSFTLDQSHLDGTKCRRSGQYIIGIIISTATIVELKDLARKLKVAMEQIYSHYEDKEFLFLDYVFSKDWGKFAEIVKSNHTSGTNVTRKILNSSYFSRSDEFACLMLKLYGSSDGRQVLQLLNISQLQCSKLFSFFDRIKGKSGGLIREVYFSIRRESVFIGKSYESEKELALYLQLANLSDFTAFSTVMIAIRVLYYDIYKLFNELNRIQPNVAEMMLATVGLPYLVWNRMQLSLMKNQLYSNKTKITNGQNLNDFYKELLKGYSRTVNSNYNSHSKVGVIITTFKPDIDLLRCSLVSIIRQSYRNLSICVIDDYNSEEVSQSIQQLIEELNDDRVILEKNEHNVGQYISRNYAMNIMNDCEYFAIQDDDDISHIQRIEYQLKNLNEFNGQLCMCQQVRFDNDMRYIADKIDPFQFDFSPASSMFRANLISEVGNFANVRSRGDVEFITRIKKYKGSDSIVNLAVPLYLMRCDLNTVSASKDRYLKTQLDVFRKIMTLGKTDNYLNGQQHALFS